MGRKIVISEEQYKKMLGEGVTLNADVSAAGGDIKRAVDTTKKQAQQSGVDMNDATIQFRASDTNESRIIKKSKLQESRLAELKKNSELYTVKDFVKKIIEKN